MEILVGKTPNCKYIVNDPHVSREHCKIVFNGQSYSIIDLNSLNGTYVNNNRIQPNTPTPISFNDEINLANSVVLDWNYISSFFNKTVISRNPFPQNKNMPIQKNHYINQKGINNYQNIPVQNNMPPAQYAPHAGLGNEFAFAMHMNKSYVGKAFISLLLYYFGFYIGGIIANILFYNEADRTKKIIGHSPPGYGCLVFLLVTHIVLPLIFIFIVILSGGALWHEIFH